MYAFAYNAWTVVALVLVVLLLFLSKRIFDRLEK
jgi:hypothetical protein